MEPIKIGIIGVGQIGKAHIEIYSNMENVRITAIAGTIAHEQELGFIADRFNIPHIYTDFRELLKRDDIDAVDVCLHNNLHAPVTIEALRAGKHVYCEKPIAGTYADGKTMLEASVEAGKMLHIQLGHFYTKETKAARHLIKAGALGKIYHARSSGYRRRGRPYVDGYGSPNFVRMEAACGGALIDSGVYNISQLLYLMDMPAVERISGKIYQETGMDHARRISGGYDVEELGLGFVRFEKNITMDIIDSWAIHMNSFDGSFIAGDKGGIRLSPFSYHTTFNDMEMDCTCDLDKIDWRWHQLRENEYAYDSPEQHWIAALQGKTGLLPTTEITLLAMLISEGIYLSSRLGREVTSGEVMANSKSTAAKI